MILLFPNPTNCSLLNDARFASPQQPSRLEALSDAANMTMNAKMNSNPENTVGVMSLAGRNPELLVSPTDDMGKIMTAIHDIELSGLLSFADGVQIAYLALKHRRNKNGGQRIVVFVGSPVTDEPKKLSTLAKMLRKVRTRVRVLCVCRVVRRLERRKTQKRASERAKNERRSERTHEPPSLSVWLLTHEEPLPPQLLFMSSFSRTKSQ